MDFALTRGSLTSDECLAKLDYSKAFAAEVHRRCRLFCVTQDTRERAHGVGKYHLGRGYALPSLMPHYAGNHKGVCLAFNKVKLCQAVQERAGTTGCRHYRGEVNYGAPPGFFSHYFYFNLNFSDPTRIFPALPCLLLSLALKQFDNTQSKILRQHV